jgi:tetratricopeptide (TPR) repeat protein
MLESSLDIPDHWTWRFEPGYSADARGALIRAYLHLRREQGRIASHLAAHDFVAPLLPRRMSATQRMHAYYVLGMASAADGAYVAAHAWISDAIELAMAMHDTAALAVLLYLRAGVSRGMLAYVAAGEDFGFSLSLVRDLNERPGARRHVAFELDLLGRWSFSEYFLGHLDLAEHLLRQGKELARPPDGASLEDATTDWLRAHLHRARGESPQALFHIMRAADVYASEGNPTSAIRCLFLASEVALDLAESFPGGPATTASASYLTLAAPYASRALQLSREARDPWGEGMALLTHARLDRLRGKNTDSLAIMQSVANSAYWLGDDALLAQAHTAMAGELRARGEIEQSLNHYRKALGAVERSQVPVLGAPARHALVRASRMRSDDSRG